MQEGRFRGCTGRVCRRGRGIQAGGHGPGLGATQRGCWLQAGTRGAGSGEDAGRDMGVQAQHFPSPPPPPFGNPPLPTAPQHRDPVPEPFGPPPRSHAGGRRALPGPVSQTTLFSSRSPDLISSWRQGKMRGLFMKGPGRERDGPGAQTASAEKEIKGFGGGFSSRLEASFHLYSTSEAVIP